MKFIEKINAAKSPFYTFEFFPPKTDQGFENLLARITRLRELGPLAVSVTWGSGGSTQNRSLDLAKWIQNGANIDAILHFTCTNIEQGAVYRSLMAAKSQGVQTILALRGDPPRGEEYWIPTDPRFNHALDLVSYIHSSPEFASHFCVGVAAYPDGHPDHEHDEDAEIDYLQRKVNAGASFIITQLLYDVDNFIRWSKKVREKGISVPIIPGVMPIQSYTTFARIDKLCAARVPSHIHTALDPIKHDDQKVKDYGVNLAIDTIRRLIGEAGAPGVHLCTLNLERSVRRVLEGIGWVGHESDIQNKLIADTRAIPSSPIPIDLKLVTTAVDASSSAKTRLSGATSSEDSGRGEINHQNTWDEFPNGRFGDFKSPAFGVQDLWNCSNAHTSKLSLLHWGHPSSEADITALFLRYLQELAPSTPFSPRPLDSETRAIFSHLESLIQKGWWTVGSQPAVDSSPSADPVFGWGPTNGHVFQKAFVEFFVPEEDMLSIAQKAENSSGLVQYFAANIETNIEEGGRSTVTWGVFPGQEIVQSTVIDRESFLSWKDEAFAIWRAWALLYAPDSAERALLDRVRQGRWLVSVVHHDYKDQDGLWAFLT